VYEQALGRREVQPGVQAQLDAGKSLQAIFGAQDAMKFRRAWSGDFPKWSTNLLRVRGGR
jgi:hypothetical protein